MKLSKLEIPVAMEGPGTIMRLQEGFGGMTVCYNELPKGIDFTPLLQGLENDSCHCPHWGYILSGIIRIIYNDMTEEVLTSDDVYYLPKGHTAMVVEDVKWIEFSPSIEFGEVMSHVGNKMAAQQS